MSLFRTRVLPRAMSTLSRHRPASGASRSSETSLLTRAELPFLAVTVLIAIGLRIVWVAYVNVDPTDGRFDDSVFYHKVARLLALGVGYADPWGRGPTAQWPPAYPASLAVLYKLFGWHLVLAKGLNIAFAAVTVVLTYIVARRIFDRRVAYLGALVLAVFPGQVYFSTLVYPAAMFGMVFMLVLLLALMWTVQRSAARWWQVLLIGFLAGVAGMVRAEGVFLAFVLAALWALTVRPWRRMARYTALAVIGLVLALTPWTVRNAVQLNEFIPLRPGATRIIARSLDPDAEGVPMDRDRPLKQRSIGAGLRYQLTHPWQGLSSAGEKLSRFYRHDSDGVRFILTPPRFNPNAPDRIDRFIAFAQLGYPLSEAAKMAGLDRPEYRRLLTEEEEARWRGLADRYFFAVGAAALLAAAVCLLRRNRASLVIIVAALGWTLLFGFFRPVPRYHFSLGPVFSIMAATFLVFVWDGAGIGWRWLLSQAKEPRPGLPEASKRPSPE